MISVRDPHCKKFSNGGADAQEGNWVHANPSRYCVCVSQAREIMVAVVVAVVVMLVMLTVMAANNWAMHCTSV